MSTKKTTMRLAILLLAAGLAAGAAVAQERADGMRFLSDVEGQFEALTEGAEALGFHVGTSPNPSSCKHYQGIVRVDGADGTPFFLVTRSGNTPGLPTGIFCDDSPGETGNGHLIVFRMDSRGRDGERMRSNRLRRDVHVDQTPPPAEDLASIYFTVVDGGLVFRDGPNSRPPRAYQHVGGMQLVGNMLAVALEHRRLPTILDPTYEVAPHESLVMFLDVSDPEAPRFTSQFSPEAQTGGAVGVIGITPLPGGLYLMVVAGGKNETLYFYRSTIGDLSSELLDWEFVDEVDGPGVEDAHQTLHFLRQGDIHGPLYLAGARGIIILGDHDRLDLYHVQGETADFEPDEEISMPYAYFSKRISPIPSTYGQNLANLAAATGFYVSPSGELIFYATEHDNDGPSGSVKAGEWRHRDIVRADSPTLLPSLTLDVPPTVDEGAATSLSGTARHPSTRPFIQLYSGVDFTGTYPVVDFDDYDLEDYDDLGKIDLFSYLNEPDHDNVAQSWSWYAPPGCAIAAIDLDNGWHERTLPGTGRVEHETNLAGVLDDSGTRSMAGVVDAVDFHLECRDYYDQPVGLAWDLDTDGSYETTGFSVPFDARSLDGPAVISLPARAQHPFGGPTAEAVVGVTIRNVSPALTALNLSDDAGNRIPADVPFALLGLPIHVQAGFADPGLPDRQTAVIDWGDGSAESQDGFATFDEAFGDGSGEAAHSHRYTSAGSFNVALTVTDDDGGSGSAAGLVEVLTPAMAVEAAVGLLDDLIATTTDPAALVALGKARKALAGNPNGMNGALDMLHKGNTRAAVAFLQQALSWLQVAASRGADVAMLDALLRQTLAALPATPAVGRAVGKSRVERSGPHEVSLRR